MEHYDDPELSFSEVSVPPRLRDCGILKWPTIEFAVVFFLAVASAVDMSETGTDAGFAAVFMYIPAIVLITIWWIVFLPLLNVKVNNFRWDIFLAVLIFDVALVCILVESYWFIVTPCALLVVVAVMVRRFIAFRKWKKGETFD